MKQIVLLLFLAISTGVFAQTVGDTITVPTFNYSQTAGSGIRDTIIEFPDNPDFKYEKILMLYNMRCKDGLISNGNNTNKGCGEWDYSCNTYISDSSRVDSVLNFANSHLISGFSGTTFGYVETGIYDYYQYRQQEVVINSTTSENLATVASGSADISHPILTAENSGKSQYIYTKSELLSAGVTAGEIDALLLEVTNNSANADYLQLRIKHTDKTELDASNPDNDEFTEVFFENYNLNLGENRLQFHTPFAWNGTSNIIVEFSFTNHNPSNTIELAGEATSTVSGIYSSNLSNLNSVSGKIEIPADPFSTISEEMTVTFWSKGNVDYMPSSNSILSGEDINKNRQLNIHHPWGNSNIYFDCGAEGASYDRISKAATLNEFAGSWAHWAFTKNTVSGNMNIYRNGELWHTGADNTRLIDIDYLVLATSGSVDRSYFGNIDEFAFFDVELDQQTIQDWRFRKVDENHPNYNNMVACYNFDEGEGSTVNDISLNTETATIEDFLFWAYERGDKINRGFTPVNERPTITLAQGEYDLTISENIVTDSVVLTPSVITEYEIIPKWGTMEHDEIGLVSTFLGWKSQYAVTYDPEGVALDSVLVEPTNTIEIVSMPYYKRYPSKYEIMSFVTPYGIYLDLGMEGKTWAFDVTDYGPILKGERRMTIERGGQRQEDMDIKFLFILGTPPHDVLDINQIWRPDSRSYTNIQADKSFEPRDFPFRADGEMFKVRSVITGHGQEGEFIGRYHTLNIDEGDIEYQWHVWTECADNPIYPQGGTWIYDRAGWCPGAPSILNEFNITEHVTAGQSSIIDYNVMTASGTSNYIVNNQMVTYGAPNFDLDASIVKISKPNSEEASVQRFNPACSNPEVIIQNTGSTAITSIKMEYFTAGGDVVNFTWNGSLEFLEKETIELPVDALSFWLSGSNSFTVNILEVNGAQDEYLYNNSYTSSFEHFTVFPEDNDYTVQLRTNNVGSQSSYTLMDSEGNLIFERDGCENMTLYEDEFSLEPGCYTLRIDDTGDNGLSFWAQPAQGSGFFRLADANGTPLYIFDPDFGGFAIFEFGIGNLTTLNEISKPLSAKVYPNPATNLLNVEINGRGKENVNLQVTNSIGTLVYENNWFTSNKYTETTIDLSGFPTGIYILSIQYGEHRLTEKVIKY